MNDGRGMVEMVVLSAAWAARDYRHHQQEVQHAANDVKPGAEAQAGRVVVRGPGGREGAKQGLHVTAAVVWVLGFVEDGQNMVYEYVRALKCACSRRATWWRGTPPIIQTASPQMIPHSPRVFGAEQVQVPAPQCQGTLGAGVRRSVGCQNSASC